MPDKLLMLEIGPGSEQDNIGRPEVVYEHLIDRIEVETLDVDPENNPTYVHDIRNPFPDELRNRYDIVLMSHVLEHVEFWHATQVLRYVAQALKIGGELCILVPSLEWAARRIVDEKESIAVMGVLYGGQKNEWDYHRCGWTIRALRYTLEDQLGMIPRRAYLSYYASTVHGKTEHAGQNCVVAFKSQEVIEYVGNPDPAAALA